MRVLVCGGAGYIGSNMTAMLAQAGHEPVVFDNLSKGHRAAVGRARFVYGDLADERLLSDTLNKYAVDAVMHFAAWIEVGESVQFPLRFYKNNFCHARNLLAAMQDAGVDKLVFSSTAAVYGIPQTVPISEDAPTDPINPYGDSKLAVERMLRFQCETGRLRYAVLRYFNACGAGDGRRLGEDHRPESHLIPLVIQAALGKREDVKIFGTDYATPDGTCIRDYIHVDDLCRAHLLALDALEDEPQIICNLGNGTGYSVREVIDTVRAVSGRSFKVTEAPRRAGDPPVLTADASRARTRLRWRPEYTDLAPIVESAWAWHSEHPNGYAE
ncbi:MAG TPA: UDP-glucose 4-epimerase GalE [Phycisphaerales bacterium]|nr:UDP-glucose 4-epimerase GalE [Phycisphaerales bacterium]